MASEIDGVLMDAAGKRNKFKITQGNTEKAHVTIAKQWRKLN